MTTTLQLARQLLGFNTINPPGSEADCMRFFADWLQESGFEVSLSSFGEGRSNLIASLPGMTAGKPLALPDIWIPCRLGTRSGDTILSVHRRRTVVFMDAAPAI